MVETLRIGYVPEHYSIPLHLSLPFLTSDVPITLQPFPSGTGHMITSLRSQEIDIAIGLTEGWIAGLGTASGRAQGGYKLVGQFVSSRLRWGVYTGRGRQEIEAIADLKDGRVGVSRMGSGSHIMSSVLGENYSFPPFTPVPLGPLPSLIDGVVAKGDQPAEADFFMWEHFTTKPYFDPPGAPLKHIGEIKTPWPSWLIVANDRVFPEPEKDERLEAFFKALDRGVEAFERDVEDPVRLMGTGELGFNYGEEDAREWLKDAKFYQKTRGVERSLVTKVVETLKLAGVIKDQDGSIDDIVSGEIGIKR